jgi:alpha-L-fucosidase 2
VCNINPNGWLNTGIYGMLRFSMQWVGGYGWYCQHVWAHYDFNRDDAFLRDHAWPVLKAAAEFFLDYSRVDPKSGKMYIGPSGSPENTFSIDGMHSTVDYGISIDQEIAYAVFTHCLEAAKILNIDDAFTKRVQEALPKLALPVIGKDGRLLEWRDERNETEIHHRHLSHLWGFYPGNRITLSDNPQLSEAVKKSLLVRIGTREGRGGYGNLVWNRSWVLNIWARFQDKQRAYDQLNNGILKSMINPNLIKRWRFTYCMDANGAITAGMAEMLLQSHASGVIHLFPATPKEWSRGSFSGLRARGGVTVNASWTPEQATVTFLADHAGSYRVKIGDEIKTLDLKEKQPYELGCKLKF